MRANTNTGTTGQLAIGKSAPSSAYDLDIDVSSGYALTRIRAGSDNSASTQYGNTQANEMSIGINNSTASNYSGAGGNHGGFIAISNQGSNPRNFQIYRIEANGAGSVLMGITNSNGNAAFLGEVTAYSSDKRLKENVEPIANAIEKVKALQGMTFTWNDKALEVGAVAEDNQHIRNAGVFAQDVEKVLPEAVALAPFDRDSNGNGKSGEDYLTVKYEKIVPLLIEAIKEQQNEIDELKEMVKKLLDK